MRLGPRRGHNVTEFSADAFLSHLVCVLGDMSRADLNAKLAAIAGCQYALITRGQALENGMSPKAIKHRLAIGEWTAVKRGVYRVTAAPQSWRQELLASVLAAGDHAVAGGLAAAALWRGPGFPPGVVELRNQYTRSRRPLHVQRRAMSCNLLAHHCTVVDRIPVTNPTRTLFDIIPLIKPERAERALDNWLAMGLTDIYKLQRLLDEIGERGRPGTALMRELLADRGEGYVA